MFEFNPMSIMVGVIVGVCFFAWFLYIAEQAQYNKDKWWNLVPLGIFLSIYLIGIDIDRKTEHTDVPRAMSFVSASPPVTDKQVSYRSVFFLASGGSYNQVYYKLRAETEKGLYQDVLLSKNVFLKELDYLTDEGILTVIEKCRARHHTLNAFGWSYDVLHVNTCSVERNIIATPKGTLIKHISI